MRGLVPETPGHCHASAMTDLADILQQPMLGVMDAHDAENRHICLSEDP